jgi:type IV secretory pathway TraG/TraD family ATPase VirD4
MPSRAVSFLVRLFGAHRNSVALPVQRVEKLYSWGGLELPDRLLGSHFAVLGTTGGGKTTLIRMLMGSVLPGPRALILDPKREFFPLLCGMGVPRDQIHVLDPFAQGSEAWDIARDITTPAAARQFAADIIPPEKGHDHPFFRNSTRAVVHALAVTFNELAPGQWQLNDFIEATRTPKQLDAILSLTPTGQEVLQSYLDPAAPQTRSNVFSTVHEKLAGYEEVAAIWAHTPKKFSLREWVRGRSVLLLALDDAHTSVLAPINAALFGTAVDLSLARPAPAPDDETWYFLDEVREAGELPGLRKALNKGRSAGFRIVLGAQDLVGLRSVYKAEADEMLAQVANLCLLRQENPDTRDWGARYLGEYEYWQLSHSQSSSSQGTTTSWQENLAKRQLMLPQELGSFPLADYSRGVFGVCTAPRIGAWYMHVSPDFIKRRLHPPAPGVPAFLARSFSDQTRVPLAATVVSKLLVPQTQPAPRRPLRHLGPP